MSLSLSSNTPLPHRFIIQTLLPNGRLSSGEIPEGTPVFWGGADAVRWPPVGANFGELLGYSYWRQDLAAQLGHHCWWVTYGMNSTVLVGMPAASAPRILGWTTCLPHFCNPVSLYSSAQSLWSSHFAFQGCCADSPIDSSHNKTSSSPAARTLTTAIWPSSILFWATPGLQSPPTSNASLWRCSPSPRTKRFWKTR